MLTRFFNYVKVNARSFGWLFLALFVGFMAIGGDGLADIAKKSFWWHLWAALGYICFLGAIICWFIAWRKADQRKS